MAWKTNVNAFLDQYAKVRVNGKVASDRSMELDRSVLYRSFDRWHKLGYRIESPQNIKPHHIQILVKDWWKDGQSPKTMQNDLSRIRTMFTKMGKDKKSVKSVKDYLPHVDPKLLIVSTIAVESKSPSEKGVNVYGLLQKADDVDMRFGLMLRLQLSFGLRVKEVLHTNPSAATIDDSAYRLYEGETKGNRVRFIRIMSKDQEQVLGEVAAKLKKREFLRWPETPHGKPSDYKWARNRYYELCKRIGLSLSRNGAVPHGLRAQFAENAKLIKGEVPKTLGGHSGQMSKDDRELMEGGIKEDLGHSFHRRDITAAYYGSYGREVKPGDPDFLKLSIEEGIKEMERTGDIYEHDPERLDDCLKMIGMLSRDSIRINIDQVYTLWRRHSRYRIGTEWSVPEEGVVQRSLAVEATRHLRQNRKGNDDQGGGGSAPG